MGAGNVASLAPASAIFTASGRKPQITPRSHDNAMSFLEEIWYAALGAKKSARLALESTLERGLLLNHLITKIRKHAAQCEKMHSHVRPCLYACRHIYQYNFLFFCYLLCIFKGSKRKSYDI